MYDYWQRKQRLVGKSEVTPSHSGVEIQLASLVEESIVDGPGLRFVLFTQGCPHRCPGCHNPQTHMPIGGTFFSLERLLDLYQQHPACRGVTLSGGEPFAQAGPLAQLAQKIHQRSGDVVVYTGYRWEQLQQMGQTDEGVHALLQHTDLLVDGPFVMAKRCLEAAFVGSSNQRLIALSALGNRLLEDIPVLPEGPNVERIVW